MTQITISDPSEVQTGYWTIEVIEGGDLEAEIHLSPDLLPDIDDTAELRCFVEDYAELLRRFEDAGGIHL
ncbi:hypothetical protein [Halobaculum lipolyticum]|uniref:Uncharacterized protein n=1 Tax=Halobaculum lipolyticum TaxID=3032001 RepID=A0ABD5WBK5_9EURY|nr:hypothetical protein [Halobaculum sp. DT31]